MPVSVLDPLLELEYYRTGAVYYAESQVSGLLVRLRRLSMSPYQKYFAICLHHFVKVLFVYGYKPTLDEPGQFRVIMNDCSKRIEVLSAFRILVKKFFSLADRSDHTGTESRVAVNVNSKHKTVSLASESFGYYSLEPDQLVIYCHM